MMALSHYAMLAGLMAAFMGLPVAIVGWIVYGLRNDMREMRDSVERRFMAVDGALEERVQRRDWLREAASSANRTDRVMEKINELSGKIESGLSTAAAVDRLTARIAWHNEVG